MPSTLDGYGQPALVLGTGTGFATGLDLAPLSEKAAQSRYVLVINGLGLFQAEGTDFSPSHEASSGGPS
jgi:hypothetical protein